MKALSTLLSCALLLCFAAASVEDNRTAADILQGWLEDPKNKLLPEVEGGGQLNVTVNLYILNFHELDPYLQTFSFTAYMRVWWNDPRLTYPEKFQKLHPRLDQVRNHIWIPDLFIVNAHQVKQYESLHEDSGIRFMPNGDVLISSRKRIELFCPMDLTRFPFDTQHCKLMIETYMHTLEHINMQWKGEGLTYDPEVGHSSFAVTGLLCYSNVENFGSGTYQRLVAHLGIRRSNTHFVAYWFGPAMVLVLLTCVQLWLPGDRLTAKLAIGGTLFLAFFVLMCTSRIDVPKVPYLTAIDKWFIVHFVFLSLAMLETILLHLVTRAAATRKQTARFEMMGVDGENESDEQRILHTPVASRLETLVRRASWLLRLTYPAIYILFLGIFWGVQAAH